MSNMASKTYLFIFSEDIPKSLKLRVAWACCSLLVAEHGSWLSGDQLYWIFSIQSTTVLRRWLLPLESLSHVSICYTETGNAVAVKMKCSSWNTSVIIRTASSLQWNGCCLATNAKEEPAYFSLPFSPRTRSIKHTPAYWWLRIFTCRWEE